MTPTTLFYIIIAILALNFLFDKWVGYLNATRFKDPIPKPLEDVYDTVEYEKSQNYVYCSFLSFLPINAIPGV